MKLPNGFGSVYKLTGNRRRPWVVKKFIDGKQKRHPYQLIDGIIFKSSSRLGAGIVPASTASSIS